MEQHDKLAQFQRETGIDRGIIFAGDVEPVSPKYLWEPYIRRENINLIQGDGGTGKTLLTMALMAAVTRGEQPINMPGALHIDEPGNCLYLGAEDELEAYRHRLDQCGADPQRIAFVDPMKQPGLGATDALKGLIRETSAKLIVFDPVQAYLGGADMNKASEVRPLLDGFRAVCRSTGCTGILIAHQNKASLQRASYRISGSMDFVNGSRSVLAVGFHPQSEDMRVAVHIKSNAAHGMPVQFGIDSNGAFRWAGTCDVEEDDVMNARRHRKASAEPKDAVLELAKALVEKGGGGWSGTAAQAIAESAGIDSAPSVTSPETFGRRMAQLTASLESAGLEYYSRRTSAGTIHTIRRKAGGAAQ